MTRTYLSGSLLIAVLWLAPLAHAEQHFAPQDTPPSGAEGAADDDAGADEGAADTDEGATDAAADADANAEAPAPDQEALDIDALRQEYLKLRDELFRSRARAAAVASGLYSTKLRIQLDYESGRFYTVTRSTLRLDGANVFDDTAGAISADRAPRFEGFVAPGRHQVTVRIEAVGKDDDRFTSTIENTFTIQATAGKDVLLRIRARDAGDIPYAWEKDQKGTYKLALDVAVEATDRAAASPTTSSHQRQRQRPPIAARAAPRPSASGANAARP